MFSPRLKRTIATATVCAAAAGSLASLGLFGGTAGADPKQLDALVGVGSDTTQDVTNALAGFSAGNAYLPLQSSAATGQKQLISFDALGSDCITTKPSGISFNRPNGSTNGRAALSRTIDGTGWGNATCGGAVDVSGQIDFARSSSGPSGSTTDLVYIPFGRDGVSFATYRASGGAPVSALTRAQLDTLFTSGPQVIGGVRIVPCGIQLGSGTYTFWNTTAGVTAGEEASATTECNSLIDADPVAAGIQQSRAQENSAADLKARGDLVAAGDQVVIGFSAAAYIAKSNGVAPGPTPQSVNVGIGSISDNGAGVNLGSPVAGTAPSLTPVNSFYGDSTFGRRVYNVFPATVIDGFGNAALKNMFVGATSSMCTSTTRINQFGFLVAPDCGVTTLRGALVANP